jgi:hypothetical protein
VRAIEHGYFGGVAQSRPSSPSPSTLAPEGKVMDWSAINNMGGAPNTNLNSSANSINNFPQSPDAVRTNPSHLRLHSNEGEAGGKYTPSSSGGVRGSYLPPPPSAKTNRGDAPVVGVSKPSGWVSPLDVHFSRPNTAGSGASSVRNQRPTSYLPKLDLDFGQSGLHIPTPTGEVDIQPTSVVSPGTEVKSPSLAVLKSPTLPVFTSQQTTLRTAQNSLRSIFPAGNAPSQQASLTSQKGSQFENSPVPLRDLSPKLPPVDPDQFPQDNRSWNPLTPTTQDSFKDRQWKSPSPTPTTYIDVPLRTEALVPSPVDPTMRTQWIATPLSDTIPDAVLDAEWDGFRPIIRDSMVSKQRVSVQHAPLSSRAECFTLRRSEITSFARSSMYSNDGATSILDFDRGVQHDRIISHVADFDFTSDHSRSSSDQQSSLTRDTNRRNRCVSDESLIITDSLTRMTANSRATDHQPRESPFSNSHATDSHSSSFHSASSSASSYVSTQSTAAPEAPPIPIAPPKTQLTLPDLENFPFPAQSTPAFPRSTDLAILPISAEPGRLSVASHRLRSASEVSQASIGDFYDSYYRQSTIQGQAVSSFGRNSIHSRVQRLSTQGQGHRKSGSFSGFSTVSKRPPPLNLLPKNPARGMPVRIVEAMTPTRGAFGADVDSERYPTRI